MISEQSVCWRCRTCTVWNQRSVKNIIVVGSISRPQSRRSRVGWPHEFFRSVGWQSRWEKIYLLWNMYVVLSRKTCRHSWASFRDLSFMKNARAGPGFSSIRGESKRECWQRNNSSSSRCVWFPWRWIKWKNPLSHWEPPPSWSCCKSSTAFTPKTAE